MPISYQTFESWLNVENQEVKDWSCSELKNETLQTEKSYMWKRGWSKLKENISQFDEGKNVQ